MHFLHQKCTQKIMMYGVDDIFIGFEFWNNHHHLFEMFETFILRDAQKNSISFYQRHYFPFTSNILARIQSQNETAHFQLQSLKQRIKYNKKTKKKIERAKCVLTHTDLHFYL